MKAKITAAIIGVPLIVLVAMLVWGGVRGPAPATGAGDQSQPMAELSELLSEGLIEAQVYVVGKLTCRVEIQFCPEAGSTNLTGVPPRRNHGDPLRYIVT